MHRLRPSSGEELRKHVLRLAHSSPELRFAHRLNAVLLVSVGRSCYEVARWFGENARTVERWVKAYEAEGCDGLKAHPGPGRPGRLTADQTRQLASDIAMAPMRHGLPQARWSGKLLAQYLERCYGITMSQRHCQRLLQRAER